MPYIICGKAFEQYEAPVHIILYCVHVSIYGYMPCQNLQFKSTPGEHNIPNTFYNVMQSNLIALKLMLIFWGLWCSISD